MTDPVRVTKRPAVVAAVVALLAATLAVDLLGGESVVRLALGVEWVGLALVAAGGVAFDRDYRTLSVALTVAGGAVAVAAMALVVVRLGSLEAFLDVVTAMFGVLVLAFGVLAGRPHGSRGLVKAGTGLVFLAVGVSGLIHEATLDTLLWATVACVVAWDAGETAINVGKQLGHAADTRAVEAVHVTATAAVGVVAVALALAVGTVDFGRLSLTQFAVLLGGVFLLALALHE